MEQTQVNLEELIRAAFASAHEAGKSEDEIKLDMVAAGATFKNVTRLFNQFMIDSGLAVSREEKEQILMDVLSGADLADEDTFNAKVVELQDRVNGATEKSAAALIRAYAKKNNIECFKKAKASSGEGKQGFAGKFYEFLVANPLCTKEEATAFIDGTDGHEETSENVKRHKSHYLGIWGLVNRIATA